MFPIPVILRILAPCCVYFEMLAKNLFVSKMVICLFVYLSDKLGDSMQNSPTGEKSFQIKGDFSSKRRGKVEPIFYGNNPKMQ